MRKSFVTTPNKIKIEDFLLEYKSQEMKASHQVNVKKSKAAWAAALDMNFERN